MKKLLLIVGGLLGSLIILAIIANAINPKSSAKNSTSDSTSSNISASKNEKSVESSWDFDSTVDKMTSKIRYTASVTANELLDLNFPYQGGVSAVFTIRKTPEGENQAFLYLSKGQLMAAHSIDDGTIRLRFDDEKPETYSVTGAADGSSNIVFINSVNKVINKLKKSKKLIIEAVLYDNGSKQMEFNTKGFKWNY